MTQAVESVGEVGFRWRDADYTLRFDMGAVRAFELATNLSIFDAFDHLDLAKQGQVRPRLSLLGDLLCAGLAWHHPETDATTAMEMAVDPAVAQALIMGGTEAMPMAKAGADNPRAPAGGARGGNGTRSSKAGRRRGNGSPISGG